MNKKYEILTSKENTIKVEDKTLYRIRALKSFEDIKKGDIGGYVSSYNNLSQEGNCWVYDDACIFDDAIVKDNAVTYDSARVYGNTEIGGNARVFSKAEIYGDALVYGNAGIYDNAHVYGNAKIYGDARVFNHTHVYGNACVFGNACVYGDTKVSNKKIQGKVASKFDDIIEIQNPEGRLVTCTLHDDKVLYSVGCQTEIDEETFKWRIENKDGGIEENPHRKGYYKIIEASKVILL